jgi:drug/metabolite transporter (DMT)-like permease
MSSNRSTLSIETDEGEKQRLLPPMPKPQFPKPQIPAPPAEEPTKENSPLVFYFLLMLAFALGNRIFGRLQVYPMHNYPLMLSLLMVAIYIPVCFAYIIPTIYFTNNITKEQRDIPKYKFAIMGGYDSLAGLLQTYAVNYIASASTVVLVQQSAIPISMIVSSIALNSKYTMAQYIGASIVMSGIVVVLVPNFMGTPATDSSGATVDTNSQLLWIAVLVVSCVPMCLSSVYKEKALGETEIDCTYLNGWVAIFQFLIAIPLCIPSAQVQGMPISNIMDNMYGGLRCWMGINTITEEYNPYNQPLDNCANAPFFVTTYLFFNVVYNFLIVIILKYGSANILFLASTVIVPLSNVVFSLHFIPGSKPMGPMDLVGLVVIMLGLVVYRFSNQLIELWESLNGVVVDQEVLDKRMSARIVAKKIESKSARFIGINQIETYETIMDTKVLNAQTQVLFRSPRVIRENLLLKLGVSPSPQLSVQGGRTGAVGMVTASPHRTNGGSPFSKPGTAANGGNPKYPYLHHPPARSMSITGKEKPSSLPQKHALDLEDGRSNSGGYQTMNK